MTNKRVVELGEINDTSCEVRRRGWKWLGHILRRDGENDSFTALGWAPKGRGTRGSREKAKQSWVEELGSRKAGTQDRHCWSESMEKPEEWIRRQH